MSPERLASLADVLCLVKRHSEAHLLLGFGSKVQYQDIDAVVKDLRPWLAAVQARCDGKPWLLVYGGDPAIAAAPDVGLLAQRLAVLSGCRVMVPLVSSAAEPPPPQPFVSAYYVMQPQYEGELEQLQLQQQPRQHADNRMQGGGCRVEGADSTSRGAADCSDGGGSATRPGGKRSLSGGGDSGGDDGRQQQRRQRLDATESRVWQLQEQGQGPGRGGAPGDSDLPAAAPATPPGAVTLGPPHEQPGLAQGYGDQDHAVQRTPTAACEPPQPPPSPPPPPQQQQQQQQERQQQQQQQQPAAPSAAPGSAALLAGTALSDGLDCGDPAAAGAGDPAAATAIATAAVLPAVAAGAAADGAACAVERGAQLWGGVIDGRPVGPSRFYLSDDFLGPGRSPAGGDGPAPARPPRLLTGVIAAGGGAIALQELQFLAARGVPWTYVRCRARFAAPGSEYGPVDGWVQQQEQQEQHAGPAMSNGRSEGSGD